MQKKVSRRQFITQAMRWSAITGLAPLLSRCSTLDSFFALDTNYYENEVLIIGAGAAGLSAAYTLKKKNKAYRVFEASHRPGGRVWTLAASAGQANPIELGAQQILTDHEAVIQLAKELGLYLREKKIDFALEWKDKLVSLKEVRQHLAPLITELKKNQIHLMNQDDDQMTVQELFNQLKLRISHDQISIFQQYIISQYGSHFQTQSANWVLQQIDFDSDELFFAPRSRWQIYGGIGQLIHTMYERVAGTIPGQLVKTQHQLIALRQRLNYFELDFQTPNGKKTYWARNVICATPLTALRHVQGLEQIEFSDSRKQWIQELGYSQTQVAAGYHQASISESFQLSQNFQLYAEQSSLRLTSEKLVDKDSELRSKLNQWYKINDQQLSEFEFVDWSKQKFILGAKSYLKPGQMKLITGLQKFDEFNGHFLFCGEHCSELYSGTVNGAIETGIAAALKLSS